MILSFLYLSELGGHVGAAGLQEGKPSLLVAGSAHTAARSARRLPAFRDRAGHDQPADHHLSGLRDARLDGGVAASVACTSRQAGTTLGVAGSAAGAAMARGGPAITEAIHTVWWIVAGLGLVIFALGLIGFKREKWDLGHIT
jgi:hypothetical protein